MKRWIKWLLKIVVTAIALYITFQKVNWQQTRQLLLTANIGWLILAIIAFNFSQCLSARRLLYFYQALGMPLSYLINLRLYYKGMFYNLFLPGGIGGDGYKVHYLYKKYHQPVKSLISATLLDRINGLTVLGLLAAILAVVTRFVYAAFHINSVWIIIAYIILLVSYLLIVYYLFQVFFRALPKASLFALMIQVLQMICVLFIMSALHVHGSMTGYLLLFLLSSIAAVVPFTVGGVGARELVFMSGAPVLGIPPAEAVAISLLFFGITAISSLAGAFVEV